MFRALVLRQQLTSGLDRSYLACSVRLDKLLANSMRHWQALLLLHCLCAAAVGSLKADKEQDVDQDVLVLTTDTFTNSVERLESPALVSIAEVVYAHLQAKQHRS